MSPVAAAAYVRVSTRKQDGAFQRSEIKRAATARRDRIAPAHWFDEKVSGSSIQRPALQKLRAAARAGKISRLYLWRLDRLTRSGIRDTFEVVEELERHGVEIVSITDGFDFRGPARDVVMAVMAWAAQMERNAIGERIRAARDRIERKGGHWGRRRAIDPATLEKARKLYKRKQSLRVVAAALKISRSTLADALAGKGHYAKSR
jgi:DNA invertase Pin-like site-specific DNA recombinase